MVDSFLDFYKSIYGFDLIYLIITVWSLIKCSSKGFVLSILSASKWLLAYVVTLILFPKIKPYVKDIIDNQYVLDLILGIGIFVVVIFFILIINKGIAVPFCIERFAQLTRFIKGLLSRWSWDQTGSQGVKNSLDSRRNCDQFL